MAACQTKKEEINFPKTDLANAPLIPKPIKTIPTGSVFGLDAGTVIYTSTTDPQFENVGKFLSESIKEKIGLDIAVNASSEDKLERLIYINQSDSVDLETPESYQLYIKKDSILLNAKTAAGAFRGVQTLRQLIPEISNDTLTDRPMWVIPSGKIIDAPKFEFRSSMLDVARHFFTVDEVKKYIDALAYYKFNTLHLHLSDDQGWRIEIKSWPKLTEVGSTSEVGGGEGGFYTQEQYQDIVAYAADRHITIIPEIDMPGHTNAATLSYPFLHYAGAETPRVRTDMKVGYSSFDAKKDTVYSFLDDVIGEIAAITPGPYFHIGGDESHVTKKSDYILFVEKVGKLVQKHNKRMIGWDEIAQADIASNAVIQLWNNAENALKAAENGSKIIVSPAKKAYLDMKYDSISEYGLKWAGYIPVDVGYQWDPETYVEGLSKESILGIEAPLWSETISNSSELEYLAFPRLIGYAELGWSPSEHLDWEDYKERLAAQVPYLEAKQINYYPTKLVDWEKE
ncbi:beta-N-acetylhexosaminidase [Muricauda oceani]|uniref:beta-N-acetylhexosaminidase n=1 Tax=Flagellimonas oceani TaxID=2698672 RepID=A0A6G7J8J6_9FLAO|nr:family 20 glycosylhydrolase [Allomuricauda oceani]MBW8243270.1 beta-N-acetylhexosaminidase [Allomuricauda oceani]QII47146.1 family 20 glycosylhydrolase [Allomuricauda oceani]